MLGSYYHMIAIQCRVGASDMLGSHLLQTETFRIVSSLIACVIVGAVGVDGAARASPHVTRTSEGQLLLLPFIEQHTIGKSCMYI